MSEDHWQRCFWGGSSGAEVGHWACVCHEDTTQVRHVGEGAGRKGGKGGREKREAVRREEVMERGERGEAGGRIGRARRREERGGKGRERKKNRGEGTEKVLPTSRFPDCTCTS